MTRYGACGHWFFLVFFFYNGSISSSPSRQIVSSELGRNSVVVFDEAHNIDNTCIDSMSVKITRKLVDKCQTSITTLENELNRLKDQDAARLQSEYEVSS